MLCRFLACRPYRVVALSMLGLSLSLLAALPAAAQVSTMPVTLASTLTPRPAWCSGNFALRPLPPVELSARPAIVADDFDLDGDLDVVIAQPSAPLVLLWNEGDFVFRSSVLADAGGHHLAVLDLDHDGRRDLLLIDQGGALLFWQNRGRFVLGDLSGVNNQLKAMAWGDLDGDGDLDLVTLEPAGLVYYTNREGHFFPRRLAAIRGSPLLTLVDFDHDGRQDIALSQLIPPRSQVWLRMASSWAGAPVAGRIPPPTPPMADLNNDGVLDLVAAQTGLDQAAPVVAADLDNDGDLDLITNQPGQVVQILENRLCAGDGLQVQLQWPHSANRDALGAQVTLHTSAGAQPRTVSLSAGSANGAPARLHWGIARQTVIHTLEIRWPDGIISRLDTVPRNAILTIERESEPNFTLVAGP
jgi:hypothetical protein